MSNNIRDLHNIKKITKLNNIDQIYNKDELKKLIINSEKIEKPNINIQNLVDNKKLENTKDFDDSIKKRINQPYKGIIKDFNYDKKIKNESDLIIHKVTVEDKKFFIKDMGVFQNKIETQNKEIKDIYSMDKETQHKKDFEYQHKYKYRSNLDNGTESDLRVDRIEFYKKEQEKMEDSKKKIDDILINLIDSGVLSENLETINYDKIDVDELEKKLIKEFGEEEFSKLLNEIKM